MRAVRFYDKGDIRVDEIPEPTPKEDEVVIDVEWGGICGSDLHEYVSGPFVIPTASHSHSLTGDHIPVTLGHEFCGRISHVPANAIGADGSSLKVGMKVMVDPRLNCSNCYSCTTRPPATNLCSNWGFLGLSGGGGGFSEKVAVRTRMVYPLPDDVKLDEAVLIEPLAVGRHALAVAGVQNWSGVSVLVIGGGPVGMSILLNLRAVGVGHAYLSEPTARRREQCASMAEATFNPLEVSVGNECRRLMGGAGVDIVFDCAGIAPGLKDGVNALRPKGTYVNVAGWETPFVIPLGPFMMQELTLKMSAAYDETDFAATVQDFMSGKFKGLDQMVTSRIALEDLKDKGFEQLVKHKDVHVKILATPKTELLS